MPRPSKAAFVAMLGTIDGCRTMLAEIAYALDAPRARQTMPRDIAEPTVGGRALREALDIKRKTINDIIAVIRVQDEIAGVEGLREQLREGKQAEGIEDPFKAEVH